MVFLIPKNVRQFALIVPCLLAGMFVQASQKPPVESSHNAWSIRWQPTAIVNGSPVVFLVNPPARLATLSGTWLDHEVSFSFDKDTKRWSGLAGASLVLKNLPSQVQSSYSKSNKIRPSNRKIFEVLIQNANGRAASVHQ